MKRNADIGVFTDSTTLSPDGCMDNIDQAQPDSVFFGEKKIRSFCSHDRLALGRVHTGQNNNTDILSERLDGRNQPKAAFEGQRNVEKNDIRRLFSQDVIRLVGIFSLGNINEGFMSLDGGFQLASKDR
jgi:hypothetical protein